MVLVDIYVPSVDKTYNFSLNENVGITSIISEITEMVEQKEQVSLVGDRSGLHLYDGARRSALPGENTLSECAIRSGSMLFLV